MIIFATQVTCNTPRSHFRPTHDDLSFNHRLKIMASKLPIPRLLHLRREGGGRRISHACDTCRERKTKCDGNRPHCTQCVVQGFDNCFYSDRKLVRLQKELESARRKIQSYEELLQNLSVEFEEPVADRIRKALKVCNTLARI